MVIYNNENLFLHSRNFDKNDTDYFMINFCEEFFNRRNLRDAINYRKALNSSENLRSTNYDSRAQTFFVNVYEILGAVITSSTRY